MNIICFHNPDEENGYLSNWYRCIFEVNGIIFSSMEQFMMYKKAECFRDHLISHQILETDDVAERRESFCKAFDSDSAHVCGIITCCSYRRNGRTGYIIYVT